MALSSLLLHRAGLRTKLLWLNGIVVAALVLLAVQAWQASSLQDRAQARQVELAEALRHSQSADMAHDALRSAVLATLLVGQIPDLTHAEAQQQAHGSARAFDEALLALSNLPLPAELAERVARNRQTGRAYGEAAMVVVHAAAQQRAAALTVLPRFEEHFQALAKELEAQAEALSAALKTARAQAGEEAAAARRTLLWVCALTIVVASAFVAAITTTIRRRLRDLGTVAQAIAQGELTQRVTECGDDELGQLGQAIDRMATSLADMIAAMRLDARRADFGKQLSEALDMTDHERQVSAVAARAMSAISPAHAMELLVSDSSRAQMERAAEHPQAGAPGCGVGSPYDCVAVRRGTVITFDNSESLNACNQLRGRPCGPVSAVCVPVTFMGRAIGVLHAAGPVQQTLAADQVQQLGTLGVQIGMRIGTVRAFEKTQIQAATDGLTGLPNRRTLEQRLRTACQGSEPFAVVMCDLDRFKMLNDTHGHGAGDAALRIFAEAARHALREVDMIGRWGGEEFAFVVANADAKAAAALVERMRQRLAALLRMGKSPQFTASFGIADSTMAGRPEQLVQLADVALYQAKSAGRDRACIAHTTEGLDAAPLVRRAEAQGSGIAQEAELGEPV